MPKRKQAVALPPPLMPQGSCTEENSPQSAFDAAAGKDIYEPEKVIAQRIAKGGVTQFLVMWAGS